MVRPPAERRSLRFSRLETERLLVALVVSLFAHLGVWGTYEVGKKTGLWEKMSHLVQRHRQVVPPKLAQRENPTIFVDVSQPSTEAPEKAKYYSDKNSRAANPDAEIDSNQPRLNGKQHNVPKTEDTPVPVKAPAKPPEPAPQPEKTEPETASTATALNPGILQPGKPDESAKPREGKEQKPPEKTRPRTLKEVLQARKIAGLEMQQDGGVHRRALTSSLDAMATPFGAYDRAIIEAIQQRWYDLLDSQQYALDRTGKVTIYFHLNPDGSVTESKITNNTVGDVLGYICLESVVQSAPFGKWPADMRRMIGANFREITFTFYYY